MNKIVKDILMQLVINEVDVWCVDLVNIQTKLNNYRQLLSNAEVAKADRFHFPIHRERYTLTHGALRSILASYLHVSPENVAISIATNRKPFIENSEIQFNLSHSKDKALFAICLQQVGVDIEFIKDDYLPDIAHRYFNPTENKALDAANDKIKLFYDIWSRKEAILKANGNTFSIKTNLFSTLTPDLILDNQHWQIIPLNIYSDYASTVVTTKNITKLNLWELRMDSSQLLKTENLMV